MSEERDAGDEKQVGKAKKQGKTERQRELRGFNEILKTYHGREFIWRLLAECGLHSQAPYETLLTHRFEGKRDVGIWLMLEIDATSTDHLTEWYPQMQSEAMARARGEE